jgi:undecaprenyl diphosphate synthase
MDTDFFNIAFILDGNRRWAKKNDKTQLDGHRAGFRAIKEVIKHSVSHNLVDSFCLYAFSTENWNRSKVEVDLLMRLFKRVLEEELDEMITNGIKLKHIGRKDRLPADLLALLNDVENKSKDNTDVIVYLALDYGGRDEIIRAVNSIPKGDLLNEHTISKYLDIPGEHTPQILIRTSNEKRLSNFLLWHLQYTELFFVDKFLPDFTSIDFIEILDDYKSRNRRFGK